MASTLLLDTVAWDLVLDAAGNIAVASQPYSLAQDAASAIKTFLGECYWDTTLGIPYLTGVFKGASASLSTLKQQLESAAKSVPDVATAVVYFTTVNTRLLGGQVQVTSSTTGQTAVANFETTNPQGPG